MSEPSNPQNPPVAPVLITGATGFIGRRIQQALLNAGITIRIILRPGSSHGHHVDTRCEVVESDLNNLNKLKQAVDGVNTVIYCAGSVRGRSLEDFLPANVDGVANILKALSSCESEAQLLLISSLAASRPEISDYANSKYLGEQVLHKQVHTPWTILRPPAAGDRADRVRRSNREHVFQNLPEDR